MGTQALSKPIPIQNFVTELRKFPEPAFSRTDAIVKFLQNTPVAPDTLAPYLTWDRQHYTRNLIDKTPLYELIAICWEVGQGSSVHNHRDQNCWMAVPVGKLLVENYRVILQKLEEGTCSLETAETLEMNPAVPALLIRWSRCTACTILASSVREPLVCTCTLAHLIPVWCTRRSKAHAAKSSCITTPSTGKPADDFSHVYTRREVVEN